MDVLQIQDCLRIVKTIYTYGNPIPAVEIPVEWAYRTHNEASNAVEAMANAEFAELCSDGQPNPNPNTSLGFEIDFDGEHDAIIRLADNFGSETDRNFQPITEYDIFHVERKVFYDEDSVKRHYYAYRDMKILPNKKNNRFRVYDETGFKFLRHSIEAALTSIDTLRLMERIRHYGVN